MPRTKPSRNASAARPGTSTAAAAYPRTPDGRYFVVRGRLWRCTNPALDAAEQQRLRSELMRARSAVGRALRAADREAERAARAQVDSAKIALGERGPVWWSDGAPDYNRRLARNTPYREWYEGLDGARPAAGADAARTGRDHGSIDDR